MSQSPHSVVNCDAHDDVELAPRPAPGEAGPLEQRLHDRRGLGYQFAAQRRQSAHRYPGTVLIDQWLDVEIARDDDAAPGFINRRALQKTSTA